MIVDVGRFDASESPYWEELEAMLGTLDRDAARRLTLDEARRMHYLYQRAASGLARLSGFPEDHVLRLRLEPLVARAYAEIHESRSGQTRFSFVAWFTQTFPATFRRQFWAFRLSVGITLLGVLFGAGATLLDPSAKDVLMPFAHLQGDPSDRVQKEEEHADSRRSGAHTQFAAMLMTHNTKVSIVAMALGVTFGVGTFVLLFYNGIILGAVVADYVRAGEGVFVAGWLLPHGSVEIPSILIAGQAGLILGGALMGWGTRKRVRARLRETAPDLATLIAGVAVLLVWAGIVESFFSQYHAPLLPYWVKIAFGSLELGCLALYLWLAGRGKEARP
jgi:uncharacterized membrane protein SpoIIM required for sporulation